MKYFNWQARLGLILIVISAIVYSIHWAIFRDLHFIYIYLLDDIAFVFVQVMLVALVLNRLLTEKEKRNRLERLNVVMGAFISELGRQLLVRFSDCDPNLDNIKENLIVTGDWSTEHFLDIDKRLKEYDYEVDITKVELVELRSLLLRKKDFLLGLLGSPTLLEHEIFTDLIQAVFHLTEELEFRIDLGKLPSSDYEHLAGDIKRAYRLLVHRWLDYMRHLQYNYPYLFSLAMRTNPFDETASPVVN
jgi:hypothetical protein